MEEHSRHCNVNRHKYQTTTPEYQGLQIPEVTRTRRRAVLSVLRKRRLYHTYFVAAHIYLSHYTKLDMTKYFALSIMLFLKNMDLMNLIILLHGTCNRILSQAKKTTKQRYYGTYHGNLNNVLRTVQISQISVY